MFPPVERLQIHLPNRHQVRFYNHQTINEVLVDERNSKTMLTRFFALTHQDLEVRQFLYIELLEHYTWHRT